MNIDNLINSLQKAQADGFKTVLFKNENYDELDFDVERIDQGAEGKTMIMIFSVSEE